MITVLTRIRSVPERYRARMREIVRGYTLVNERDEDWVDDFYAHRLALRPRRNPRREPRRRTYGRICPSVRRAGARVRSPQLRRAGFARAY